VTDITLTIGGTRWGGWKTVQIQRGIEQVAGQFSLGVSDRWPGQDVRRDIRPGDACTVQMDGQTVITGHVDDVAMRLRADSREIEISGRDATGDLVDCSVTDKQYPSRTMRQIAEALCKPFGVPVAVAAGLTLPVMPTFRADHGETVWEVIERLARICGVLAVADGAGGLLITRATTTRVATELVEGQNVLEAEGAATWRERFSTVTVVGVLPGSDGLFGAAAAGKGVATDTEISRHRPLVMQAEDASDRAGLRVRAEWERNVRSGRGRRVSVTVPGWSHAGGLWQPNTRVGVSLPSLALAADLLITSVTHTLDDGGTRTQIEMVRPEAFDRIPMPEPRQGGVW